MNKVVIAGGSGFIGSALIKELSENGYECVVLSRSQKTVPNARVAVWDAKSLGDWAKEFEGAKGVINLSGETLAQKWTPEKQERFISSRVESTTAFGAAIKTCQNPPEVWVNSSGVDYYGDQGSKELDESSPPDNDFLAQLCIKWEEAILNTDTPNTRKTCLRTGLVCGWGGGAFPILYKLTRFFLGGQMGNGQQYNSWIHLKDLVAMYRWCLENEAPQVMNATAPHPVTNKEFMAELRRVVGRPWCPPAPAFVMKLTSALGAPPAELLLTGQRVIPKAALESGFQFEFNDLKPALENLEATRP